MRFALLFGAIVSSLASAPAPRPRVHASLDRSRAPESSDSQQRAACTIDTAHSSCGNEHRSAKPHRPSSRAECNAAQSTNGEQATTRHVPRRHEARRWRLLHQARSASARRAGTTSPTRRPCAKSSRPSPPASGDKVHKRYCMDTYTWPNEKGAQARGHEPFPPGRGEVRRRRQTHVHRDRVDARLRGPTRCCPSRTATCATRTSVSVTWSGTAPT